MKKNQTFPFMQQSALDFVDPNRATASLNDLLRQRLNGSLQEKVELVEPSKATNTLLDSTVAAVDEILHHSLDKSSLDRKLEQLFEHQQSVYANACIPAELRKRQFIGQHGWVMAPDCCITTLKDTLRVRAFIRAIDKAISKLSEKAIDTLHIVYPACGPLAPLLLPLISYYQQQELYRPQDLQVTLIDMQPGAIASLHAQIDALQVSPFIRDILLQDGCNFQTSDAIHIVVLEAMQHGFSREGHLALARHFAQIMEPDGMFIPKEISLRAIINEGQQEYCEQWQGHSAYLAEVNMSLETLERRIELGEILNITANTLRHLKEQPIDEFTHLIECGSVRLPELPASMEKPLLMICSRVIAGQYEDSEDVVGEYDSGITHPLPDMQVCINFVPTESKPGDLLVNSGDRLKFYYRLNGLPGFLPTKG